MSHAGLALLRQLSDRTGLAAGLSGALPSPLAGHDRGRVFTDLACAIADGARVISDFRVMGDQRELFGAVASVPTAWRSLREVADGGDRTRRKIDLAVNRARRRAWEQGAARHGSLPAVRVADRALERHLHPAGRHRHHGPLICDKEGAEANFKGYGHHPVIAACDNTGEALAWVLRPGSAGSNTAADHLDLLAEAIEALPPRYRRRLMVTCDGAGASHDLVKELDRLASRHGYEVTWSVGWALGERERAAIGKVPDGAWAIAIDHRGEVCERRADGACPDRRCPHPGCWVEEASIAELTSLLREGPGGDQLEGWPKAMRVFARRERPHPGAQLSLSEEACGWRYSLWATNLPESTRGWRGQPAYVDAAHRFHARVEDFIRAGKETGLGRLPSKDMQVNAAWMTAAMIACTLLAWFRLLALDGDLARAEPKTLRYRILHAAARLVRGGRRRTLKLAATWPWAEAIITAWQLIQAVPHPT